MVFASLKQMKIDSETVTGTLTGATGGVIAYLNIPQLLITGLIAIATGFLGALGAHLFKVIKSKLK